MLFRRLIINEYPKGEYCTIRELTTVYLFVFQNFRMRKIFSSVMTTTKQKVKLILGHSHRQEFSRTPPLPAEA